MPKLASTATGQPTFKHQNNLENDILATGAFRERTKSKKRKSLTENNEPEGYIDSRSSRKILKIGRELATEAEIDASKTLATTSDNAFAFDSRFGDNSETRDDVNEFDEEDMWADENDASEEAEVDPNDLDMFNKFLPPGEQPTLDLHVSSGEEGQKGRSLADIILEQIALHEAQNQDKSDDISVGSADGVIEIDARVVEVYSKVGLILSRYKSGKLPKPLKILPTLPHWEELLHITKPDSWTPNACEQATRIFVSSNPKVVQRYLETVLLDRVREDIHENKKLNSHLYMALRKATYKPAGFFKGFLFPLVESRTCTLREARIISKAIKECSIPPLHSSAALFRLTELAAEASISSEGGGSTNVFITAFLEKGYALPYKVIDNLVFHFLRFRAANLTTSTAANNGNSDLVEYKIPVLWHQSLLAFARRYKDDITEDQREALLDLLLVRGHKDIGPEVRRELLVGRGRGVIKEGKHEIVDGDDTMIDID